MAGKYFCLTQRPDLLLCRRLAHCHNATKMAWSTKLLPDIIFCQLTEAEALRGRADVNAGIWSRIKINKDERYHFLQRIEPANDALEAGLPELVHITI